MQEELPECFCVVSQQKTSGPEVIWAALKGIHAFVFEKQQKVTEEPSPRELLLACESALEKVGGQLGKRKPLDLARLSMGVVIVEIIARLTRILFWGMLAPSETPRPRRIKLLEEDGEEVEGVLLPRFFLKLAVSPIVMREVLMKAPWEVFLRRYGVESAPPGEFRECVPAEVASVLSGLRANFGCDFLFHVRLQTELTGSHLVGNNSAAEANDPHVASAGDAGGGLLGPPEADGGKKPAGYGKNVSRFGAKRCCSSSFPGASAPPASSWECNVARKHPPPSVEQSQAPCAVHSRHRFPAYKLTRRRPGMRQGTGAGNECVDAPGGGATPHSSTPEDDRASAEEHDGDAEVLAPETPVKKRVRRDQGVVPPSPSRPTHGGLARLFNS
ncbi:uncharacterized protein Tco025E_08556 [Trypanosoma conorhini]|uniref:Uncharacterized protein n=1 Tax=Trypanosoma conorhini TaxID=83891 RepID=A0A422N818_9TRYP|nr:uncharacterized protein Tco025E_08556 [Trypanosoma conorhini]RNF01595.1 hypothetical protein Tco025E_08556 [Trypanosoma conorhini]